MSRYSHRNYHGESSNPHTSDETTAEDRRGTRAGDTCGLNNDTNDEDHGVDQDGVLSRKRLGNETAADFSVTEGDKQDTRSTYVYMVPNQAPNSRMDVNQPFLVWLEV